MRNWIVTAGAAAIALASPVLAGPGGHGEGPKGQGGGGRGGNGHDGGGGGGGGFGQGGGDHQPHGGPMRAEFQPQRQQARPEHRAGGMSDHQAWRQAERQAGPRGGFGNVGARVKHAERGNRPTIAPVRHGAPIREDVVRQDARIARDRLETAPIRGLEASCPPGLAKKNNGCLPPGQARKLLGQALPAALSSQLINAPYRQWYRDDDRYLYRNDNDYIYRVRRDGGIVDSLFPVQDRDYSYYPVGMTYPSAYDSYNVPYQYQSYYPDGSDYDYRYGDGAIYQVNRSNNAINSIVALLAGDLGVGQQMPSDYGVYNIPMQYRDRYYDSPDAMYRYNDGYIYQADPKTRLITAVIDALV